jgi:hypothetical protein
MGISIELVCFPCGTLLDTHPTVSQPLEVTITESVPHFHAPLEVTPGRAVEDGQHEPHSFVARVGLEFFAVQSDVIQ